MTAKRTPPPGYEPQPSLPHEPEREGGQPYAKEVGDYSGGVASPPKEQVGPEADRKTKKRLPSRNSH
jgi:hypothetical protein